MLRNALYVVLTALMIQVCGMHAMDVATMTAPESPRSEFDILRATGEELENFIQVQQKEAALRRVKESTGEPTRETLYKLMANAKDNTKVLPELRKFVRAHTELLMATDANGNNALHEAIILDDVDTLQTLWEELSTDEMDAEIERQNKNGMALFHNAAFFGRNAILNFLGTKYPGELNARDKNGNTPLHWASMNGRLSTVLWFLMHPAVSICEKNGKGETPILMAAREGHFDIVEVLVEKSKICINEADSSGNTVLYYILDGIASDKLIQKLLKAGANPLQPNNLEQSPLEHARARAASAKDVDEKSFRNNQLMTIEELLSSQYL